MAGGRVLCALGVALLMLPLAIGSSPVAAYPTGECEAAAADALDYLRGEQSADGGMGDFSSTCWVVCAVVAADEDPADWDYAGDSLVDYLEAEVDSLSSASDYSLAIMAVVAIGEDPTSFGGVDLVDQLEDEYGDGQLGVDGLYDDFWGLIALVAAGDAANSSIVSDARDFIESNQSNDPADFGSWGWEVGAEGDVDDTAAAIMALIAAGMEPDDPVIVRALVYLRQNQDGSGGFLSFGTTNADTNSWAILSIVAADQDPDSSDWQIGGNSPVDDLLSFQQAGEEFYWQSGDPGWFPYKTNAYAAQALLGVPWPVEIAASSSAGAELAVAPDEFEFAATEDGDDPLDRILEIWNEGDGTLEWDVESDEDWLELSPSSGSSTGEHDDVTLSVDISGLDVDDYEATITITAGGADGSPETVDVALEIFAAADGPEIAFHPSSLEFTAEEGESDPADQVLEIWNADSDPDSIDWEVECDEDWLDLSPSDGTMDEEHEEITVSVDIDGLDADTYEATITITSPDADNSPETIDVTLEIEGDASSAEDPEIDFSPSRFRFTAEQDGDDPDDEVLTIWNSGEGTLGWSVSDDAGWLSLSPRSGTSTGQNDEDEVDVMVDISGLDAGEYEAEISIKDSDASNSPEELTVTLTVEESEDPADSADDEDYYQLTTPTTPAGAGSITRSVQPGAQGYLVDTQLTVTAVPFAGYVFTGWTGDAAGPQNPINVLMSGDRTIMANFLRFDNAGLPNVGITFASPGIYSVSVIPYPTASIPSSPEGFRLLSAYIVEPQGSGSFSLEFSGLPDANSVAIFKVQDGAWMQLPRSVLNGTAIQVTMGAEDPVIALVTPGSSGGGILSSVQGLFSGADSTTLLVVGIAILVVVIVVIVLVLFSRRESY